MVKLIIAISGWKRSGKDTMGDRLCKVAGLHKLSLAGALKYNTAIQYGLPLELFHDQDLKEEPIKQLPACTEAVEMYYENMSVGPQQSFWTPRALLVHEGKIKRLVMKDYWVRALCAPIAAAEQLGQTLFTLTDWRFRDEYKALKRHYPDYNIVTVRVNRFDKPPNQDDTERDLDNFEFDHVINNTGSLEDFELSIDKLVGEILNERRVL